MRFGAEYNRETARTRLGLIVLQPDETIEADFRRMLPEDLALYVSRIPSEPEVTTGNLGKMEAALPEAARLLPRAVSFNVVGYGCTSGASVIGADRVAGLVAQGCQTAAVTEPLTALVAAAGALGVSRLAMLSPYVAEVNTGLRNAMARKGLETPVFGSFDVAEEAKVARITAASVETAAFELAACGGVEALFLSCTNLRTLDLLPAIEERTGLPVLSSNQVLAWHMTRLAGRAMRPGFGRLSTL